MLVRITESTSSHLVIQTCRTAGCFTGELSLNLGRIMWNESKKSPLKLDDCWGLEDFCFWLVCGSQECILWLHKDEKENKELVLYDLTADWLTICQLVTKHVDKLKEADILILGSFIVLYLPFPHLLFYSLLQNCICVLILYLYAVFFCILLQSCLLGNAIVWEIGTRGASMYGLVSLYSGESLRLEYLFKLGKKNALYSCFLCDDREEE